MKVSYRVECTRGTVRRVTQVLSIYSGEEHGITFFEILMELLIFSNVFSVIH